MRPLAIEIDSVTGGVRQVPRPWLSYLILGGFLAVQVPFRLAESQLARAGLLALGAGVFLTLGIRAVRRRTAGRPAARNPGPGG